MRLKHGDASRKNRNPIHWVWGSMVARCRNPKDSAYFRYGKRGIKVCDDWMQYESFKSWAIGAGYERGLTLERIDNNEGYSPHNCRWATRKEQARNRRSKRLLTYRGETKSMIEWAESSGLDYHAVASRINRYGWAVDRALETPVIPRPWNKWIKLSEANMV